MNTYVTGGAIKKFREEKGLTQSELAEKLAVSDKAVSRWETGRGYPDISLLEQICTCLGVSVCELLSGNDIKNSNKSFNIKRIKIYVCPICGNVIVTTGEAVISCCGVNLLPEEAGESDEKHFVNIEKAEDEYYVTVPHDMTKSHFISFMIAVRDDNFELKKLYPEQMAETRFKISKTEMIYFYCNRHGLFKVKL